MFKCEKCGFVGESFSGACTMCGEVTPLTEREIGEALDLLRTAMKSRKYEYAVSGYRSLAELGVTEAQIEYGKILEGGELVPKDLDLAMKYFYSVAQKCNAYGAYRYSRLISRHSDTASRFWLVFAAHLGCKEAYAPVAEQYSSDGNEVMAGYYYSLAALLDDTSAIVTMAKRYYNGIGAEPNEAYAKWFLDKLTIPPFHAIKMAYKLRSVRSAEPPFEKPGGYEKIVRALCAKAKAMRFFSAYRYLVNELSKSDDYMLYTLGVLWAEGIGGEADSKRAVALLEKAAAHGVGEAYKYLADALVEGRMLEKNTEQAMAYYKAAAEHGMSNAYELMGDLFCEGRIVERDVGRAIELYDMAAREGDGDARRKADELKDERESYFTEGCELINLDRERAFAAFASAAAMGYLPSYRRLAECLEVGVGIGKNRPLAFAWYLKAADEGDREALFEVGRCYARGIGIGFNFKSAIEYLSRAHRVGDARAGSELERLFENKKRHLSRQLFSSAIRLLYQKKFSPAARMLEALKSAGHAKGIYTLGCLYEFGVGTPTDRELAFSLYETAYSLKFRDPRQVYKLCILKMIR